MGQQYSFALKVLHDYAVVLKDLAVLNHESLENAVAHLNKTLRKFAEGRGQCIMFAIKEPSEEYSPYLWKATTRIVCYKIDSASTNVDSERIMDLRQFCKLYRDITKQLRHMHGEEDEDWQKIDPIGEEAYETCSVKLEEIHESLCASVIFTRVDEVASEDSNMEECCICMDQKAEVILSCVHCFCKTCIEKWSDVNETCPLCRDKIHGKKDLWEMPERPSDIEIGQFVLGMAEGAGAPT
ncbi:hypothetical protein pdam_00004485 [Pocillopora damicornis]|uniref:RING finger protein 141 n=2 Tax=Pocillopora damicornis TaxID=46731 RepID=A0A3M6V294_POCDA|nr:hypothetical protein pdam_00004485 [Pocillopora damicornis]